MTERVAGELQRHSKGFELGPVEMVQSPKLKRPKRPTKRSKPRVWLPYEGPPLYELWLTSWTHMDAERTTAKLAWRCQQCGSERWELEGHEREEYDIVIHKGEDGVPEYESRTTHYPRISGKGLFVRSADLMGADIFGVHEFSGWLFCTDRVKTFIEENQFTNVAFLEMGEVI
jgi:hypothetical protein